MSLSGDADKDKITNSIYEAVRENPLICAAISFDKDNRAYLKPSAIKQPETVFGDYKTLEEALDFELQTRKERFELDGGVLAKFYVFSAPGRHTLLITAHTLVADETALAALAEGIIDNLNNVNAEQNEERAMRCFGDREDIPKNAQLLKLSLNIIKSLNKHWNKKPMAFDDSKYAGLFADYHAQKHYGVVYYETDSRLYDKLKRECKLKSIPPYTVALAAFRAKNIEYCQKGDKNYRFINYRTNLRDIIDGGEACSASNLSGEALLSYEALDALSLMQNASNAHIAVKRRLSLGSAPWQNMMMSCELEKGLIDCLHMYLQYGVKSKAAKNYASICGRKFTRMFGFSAVEKKIKQEGECTVCSAAVIPSAIMTEEKTIGVLDTGRALTVYMRYDEDRITREKAQALMRGVGDMMESILA